ncbi:MAG: tRNA (adenosine(37)-N6)-dimethylallyltransferase MiaA [candidate division Zixibacteria bacterium]|nr:tRNA (adenosine(37)-N6)-dimethylallyltransferase MiaA [candidate division Zixibacteria bacterium]
MDKPSKDPTSPRGTRPILAIVGPTGSGKNDLAQDLAAQENALLVSVDSRKVYRGLDIGTAKPTVTARERFGYAMVDCADPEEHFSAGRYMREAREAVDQLVATDRPIILVGGTGFYLDAFLRGLPELPEVDWELRRQIRDRAEAVGWESMHADLAGFDPVFAARVHPRDKTRIRRAHEVHQQTGRPLSEWLAKSRVPYTRPVVVVCPDMPREILYERIGERVLRMVRDGLFEEVQSLMARGLGPDSPGMATVGYLEGMEYVSGRQPQEETIQQIIHNTRLYAKRQMTWFRHRPYIHHIPLDHVIIQRLTGFLIGGNGL